MEHGLMMSVLATIVLALGSCAMDTVETQAVDFSATICNETEGRICPEYKPK